MDFLAGGPPRNGYVPGMGSRNPHVDGLYTSTGRHPSFIDIRFERDMPAFVFWLLVSLPEFMGLVLAGNAILVLNKTLRLCLANSPRHMLRFMFDMDMNSQT